MNAKTININFDNKCKRCRKPGTVNDTGLCMGCIHVIMKEKQKTVAQNKELKSQDNGLWSKG
jgi:hypothetical protein